ncbi:hypothetical protein, partial [Klebsiella pneumoniae]|uniref:hypothetical protein n=1 Tax=Klebsiella pneumoniae TaxID=573 RepID=UPI0040558F2B
MTTGFKNSGEVVDNVPYRRLVCSLMYLATTVRPDIAYSVSFLSRFLDKPTLCLWKATKRVLRYLKGTQDLGLNFKRNSH